MWRLNKQIKLAILLVLQVFLYVVGVQVFGFAINPVLFAFVSVLIFWFVVRSNENTFIQGINDSKLFYTVLILGIAFLGSTYEELRKIFQAYPLPQDNSDVIVQLEVLVDRWINGVYPYQLVDGGWQHSPFPVYMPLHWFPFSISNILAIDTRWSALIIYAICSLVYIFMLVRRDNSVSQNLIFALIPGLVLWFHILFLKADLAVSPEYLIGGYYLLLCAGLLRKNLLVITLGVILCLLSRYTFIFWLPVLFFATCRHFGLKKGLLSTAAVVAAVVVLYILPFLLGHWDVFGKGLAYHNQCATLELTPSDNAPMRWSYTYGLNFAYYFRILFSQSSADFIATMLRTIQAVLMLLVCFLGWRQIRLRNTDFSRVTISYLYLTILLFFLFSPLVYRYYYFTLFIISFSFLGLFNYKQKEDSKS